MNDANRSNNEDEQMLEGTVQDAPVAPYVPEEKREAKLAQDGTVMTDRNIAVLVDKGKEVLISTQQTEMEQPELIGFISGLDQENLQICLSATRRLVLVARKDIVSIAETGNYLKYNTEEGQQIQVRIKHFQQVASNYLDEVTRRTERPHQLFTERQSTQEN